MIIILTSYSVNQKCYSLMYSEIYFFKG